MDTLNTLPPFERPTPEEFGRLARDLLRELAEDDGGLAERLRDEGLD